MHLFGIIFCVQYINICIHCINVRTVFIVLRYYLKFEKYITHNKTTFNENVKIHCCF